MNFALIAKKISLASLFNAPSAEINILKIIEIKRIGSYEEIKIRNE